MRPWRWVVLVLAAVYFVGPLAAAAEFSLRTGESGYGVANYLEITRDPALRDALVTSLQIALATIAVTLVLMVPTVVYVRLRLPRLALLLEGVTVLPIVIPPVVMAAGMAYVQANSGAFQGLFGSPLTALTPFYVILALPFTYRSLDAGLRAIDLRTLVEAARNLGAGWGTVLGRVILPNIRTAVLGAAFLTLALVLGEVVIARILLYVTFPVQVVQTGQTSAGVSVALSLASLALTWVLLLALSFAGGARRRGRTMTTGGIA
ncbi:MAG TPA: ABC transporter permease subunit [Mycobacteriales bacterium]|jgi:putative spermidine/putrescine transport system permease protein|nr:ABC transporter permease subunit [Mycobacteriales bacterium]